MGEEAAPVLELVTAGAAVGGIVLVGLQQDVGPEEEAAHLAFQGLKRGKCS